MGISTHYQNADLFETLINPDDVMVVMKFLFDVVKDERFPTEDRIAAANAFSRFVKPMGIAHKDLIDFERKSNS